MGLSPLVCKIRMMVERVKRVTALIQQCLARSIVLSLVVTDRFVDPGFRERDSLGNNLNRISCQAGRVGTWIQAEVNWKKTEKYDLSSTCEPVSQESHPLSYLLYQRQLHLKTVWSRWALISANSYLFPQSSRFSLPCPSFLLIFQTKLWPLKDVYI